MPDFFEEIKAVHWPLEFLRYLLRNLQLVVGCIISGEIPWYESRNLFGGLKNRWW